MILTPNVMRVPHSNGEMGEQISDSATQDGTQVCTVDEVLSKAGVIGIVQILVHVNVFLLLFTTSCQIGLVFFTGFSPTWKCVAGANSDFCDKYNNITFTVDMEMFSKRCHLNRSQWTYAVAHEQYSVVTEFDLVCEKTTTATLIASTFFVGTTFGALLCGSIGDGYGRKPTIVVSITFIVITSIALRYSHTVWQMYLFQFIRGIGSSGSLYPAFVYLSEISPPGLRSATSSVAMVLSASSFLLMDLMAFLLQNWRELSL